MSFGLRIGLRGRKSSLVAALIAAASVAGAQTVPGLPPGAVVIETANVDAGAGKQRTLVLWMVKPEKQITPKDEESCATWVTGDYWEGPARVSLVDSASQRLINTVNVQDSPFHIPFRVGGRYYMVPGVTGEGRGKPRLLDLRDLTGDGAAAEFPLYEYVACGIVSAAVFGYSGAKDQVLQYSVEVRRGNTPPKVELWVDQVFARKPVRPGVWDFRWSPGHGDDAWYHEQVHFDPKRQMFVQETREVAAPK